MDPSVLTIYSVTAGQNILEVIPGVDGLPFCPRTRDLKIRRRTEKWKLHGETLQMGTSFHISNFSKKQHFLFLAPLKYRTMIAEAECHGKNCLATCGADLLLWISAEWMTPFGRDNQFLIETFSPLCGISYSNCKYAPNCGWMSKTKTNPCGCSGLLWVG